MFKEKQNILKQFINESLKKTIERESDHKNVIVVFEAIQQIFRMYHLIKSEIHEIVDLCYEKIDALKHNKIQRKLGSGSYGTAMLMSNDHVLKLYRPDLDEDEWYKTMQTAAFSGKGSRNMLMVYDHGKVTENLAYAEISRVIDLRSFLKMSDRDADKISDQMDIFTEKYLSDKALSKLIAMNNSQRLERLKRGIDQYIWDLGDDERKKLAKSLLPVLNTVNDKLLDEMLVIDLHVGNIGVDQVTGAWIMFDI